MVVSEAHSRPDPSNSSRRVVMVKGYGTDLNHYTFDTTVPTAIAEQIQPGQYITATVGKDRTVHAFVWAFQATDGRDTIPPELEQIAIHDISLNIRVSGMTADPSDYFVQVGGYPSIGNPYVVEFEVPLEIAQRLKNATSVNLLIDCDSIARKIIIGDDTIDVTHVGKL